MASTTTLLLTLLLCHSFLPCQADDIVVDRTNWGLIFKQVARLHNGDDMWQHTYEVDYSDIEPYLMSSKTVYQAICTSNFSILCSDFRQSVKTIDQFRMETFDTLNSTVSIIHDLIPQKALDTKLQQRTVRALLPFIADISQSLVQQDKKISLPFKNTLKFWKIDLLTTRI